MSTDQGGPAFDRMAAGCDHFDSALPYYPTLLRKGVPMSRMEWYDSLTKPSWTPEPATIGLIWLILYLIILVTFGFVFYKALRRQLPWQVAVPFAINLVANLLFTPIQFGLRNLPLAAFDILIVWGTILWMIAAVWKHHRWVALAQFPYLVWVSIATVLQWTITWWNR